MTSVIRRFRLLLPIFLVVALASVLAAGTQAPADKIVYVAVVDKDGTPVKDLKANEFALREDNLDREIVSAKPAAAPLQIAILADTTRAAGTSGLTASGSSNIITDIRTSLTEFVQDISGAAPDAEMMLMEFGQASITVVPFTSKLDEMEKGITKLFPKQNAASVLLEAIMESSKELGKRKSPRRAIVILNVEPSEEQSREPPNNILTSLGRTGASIWVVSIQNGTNRNESRGIVLGGLTTNTGGQRESISNEAGIKHWLNRYSDALTSQYEVTYRRPAGTASAAGILMGTTRQGLKLHYSKFAPQ